MIRVRHGAPFASGMTATGFWLGITVGRLILGFVTPRIGEKLAIGVGLIEQSTGTIELTIASGVHSVVDRLWSGFVVRP